MPVETTERPQGGQNDGTDKPTPRQQKKVPQSVQGTRWQDTLSQHQGKPAGRHSPLTCIFPERGYLDRQGNFHSREKADTHPIAVPCGGCIECRKAKARGWALRCTLEQRSHTKTAFTTLTYDDEHLPGTLSKRDLALWLKRIRKRLTRRARKRKGDRSQPIRRLRFFACGEYGETNHRPHYHAILYGADENDRMAIQETWGKGHTYTVNATPAAIAYVAGYAAKKYGDDNPARPSTIIDEETGELLWEYQKPFLQMSRRPGIGANAKKYTASWREYAVLNGKKLQVPKFLHEAWKQTATQEEKEQLAEKKYQRRLTQSQKQDNHNNNYNDIAEEKDRQQRAALANAIARQQQEGARRKA